jgi:hypothetical protein
MQLNATDLLLDFIELHESTENSGNSLVPAPKLIHIRWCRKNILRTENKLGHDFWVAVNDDYSCHWWNALTLN